MYKIYPEMLNALDIQYFLAHLFNVACGTMLGGGGVPFYSTFAFLNKSQSVTSSTHDGDGGALPLGSTLTLPVFYLLSLSPTLNYGYDRNRQIMNLEAAKIIERGAQTSGGTMDQKGCSLI